MHESWIGESRGRGREVMIEMTVPAKFALKLASEAAQQGAEETANGQLSPFLPTNQCGPVKHHQIHTSARI